MTKRQVEIVAALSAEGVIDQMQKWVRAVPNRKWASQDQAVFEYVAQLVRTHKCLFLGPQAEDESAEEESA